MRFSLPVLTASQVLIAQNPEIGVESIVNVSPVEVVKLGRVLFDAAGVPTWAPKAGASYGVGLDLHIRLDTKMTCAPTAWVGLAVHTTEAGPNAVYAIPEVPSWTSDQSRVFPVGWSADMIPEAAPSELVLSVEGIESTSGIPPNTEFSVWGSPAASNFVEIGYKRNVSGPYNVPASVALADGYNPAAAIKQGRPEIPELNMEFLHVSAMGGLARYNGHRTSVWVKVLKDKAVHSENVVYVGYRPEATPSRGDGNDEVVESSSGPYEDVLLFTAR